MVLVLSLIDFIDLFISILLWEFTFNISFEIICGIS